MPVCSLGQRSGIFAHGHMSEVCRLVRGLGGGHSHNICLLFSAALNCDLCWTDSVPWLDLP